MGWARWSAEEYITKYEKDKNQEREDEHEHDIAPIRQEWSVWSFSRDHVCQVQHVTQRPSSFAVPNLHRHKTLLSHTDSQNQQFL